MNPRARALVASLVFACGVATAQTPTDARVDAATRASVVDRVIALLNERYVFPDVARRVGEALRTPARQAALKSDDAVAFAAALTDALQDLTRDKHLRVMYSATPVPEANGDRPADADLVRYREEAKRANHGVERVERLPGNIGLLELRGFMSAELAGETLAAAMTLVAHTDALIIDLRRNGGGDPATVALVSSYLLDERTHLNSLYFRPEDRTTQFWSHDWVPGLRFGGRKPVYVLTSSRTFSAAEEFSYNLQSLRRARTVGETTGGGAHPGELSKVGEHFRMFVATGRAINPLTGTNWEGTGVRPDLPVAADDALRTAQLHALDGLLSAPDLDPERRRALEARRAELARSGA